MLKKAKLLEMIEKEFHNEYMIVEEVDEDSLTFPPFSGVVPDLDDEKFDIAGSLKAEYARVSLADSILVAHAMLSLVSWSHRITTSLTGCKNRKRPRLQVFHFQRQIRYQETRQVS
ncbi:MAG: hypothetical protein LBR80_18510 [Deltaproteobacteria bacterium]|nr:hypothetical protein [Deltaproteobacteria bacterium]